MVQASLNKKANSYIKNNQKKKRAESVAEELEHLPRKCDTLSSNSSSTTKKKERERERSK
jgi:hypothetical protein